MKFSAKLTVKVWFVFTWKYTAKSVQFKFDQLAVLLRCTVCILCYQLCLIVPAQVIDNFCPLMLCSDVIFAGHLTINFICFQLCSDVLYEVCRSCHNLVRLDLAGLSSVDDDCLLDLARNCPKLAQLSIKSCRKVC